MQLTKVFSDLGNTGFSLAGGISEEAVPQIPDLELVGNRPLISAFSAA